MILLSNLFVNSVLRANILSLFTDLRVDPGFFNCFQFGHLEIETQTDFSI